MEEKKEYDINTKDDRPFFMTWDKNSEKWILNIKDPKTNEVLEKKVFMNGGWRRLEENAVQRRRR